MQWIETHRDVVYPWQCDHMGHMNVMYYTGMFDRATWQLFAQAGFNSAYLRETNRGMAAVQSNTSYRAELLAGDLVVIRSRFLEVHERKALFEHEMLNSETGAIAATNQLVGVHIDRNARRAVPIPDSIKAAIGQMIEA